MSSVYFRTGIIQLNSKQEDELKRLYKEPMLQKIRLSTKFPKELLYARRIALSVGFISPNTALVISALKLYVENIRIQSNIADLITINKEHNHILSGLNKYPILVHTSKPFWI